MEDKYSLNVSKFEKLIENMEFSMSKFQIERFVLNEQITDYKKLKQALLEYNSRLSILEQNMADIEIQEANISDLDLDLMELESNKDGVTDKTSWAYKKFLNESKRLLAEKRKNEIKLREFNRNQKNLLFELSVFEKNIDQLLTLIDEDTFISISKDENMKENYESDYWVKRFANNAFTDMMSSGTISNGLLQSILNMPTELIGTIFQESIMKKMSVEQILLVNGQLAEKRIKGKNEFNSE